MGGTDCALRDQLDLSLAGQVCLLKDVSAADITSPLLLDLVLFIQTAKTPFVIAGLGRDDVEVGNVVALADMLDDVLGDAR